MGTSVLTSLRAVLPLEEGPPGRGAGGGGGTSVLPIPRVRVPPQRTSRWPPCSQSSLLCQQLPPYTGSPSSPLSLPAPPPP